MTSADWNVPETEVFANARALLDAAEPAVMATIVDVEGSAYRRPGAKMLITPDGSGVGHITAGCLEDEVRQLAKRVRDRGRPLIETFDLRPEAEDDVWGLGVGCNGIIDILLEPVDTSFAPVLDAVEAEVTRGVITVLDGPEEAMTGSRAFYDPETGDFDTDTEQLEGVLTSIASSVAEITRNGRAETLEVDGWRLFIDGIEPPTDLVVIGTGHDVAPIAELGYHAGYRVTVIGFRGASATSERFPHADAVLSTSPPRLRETFDFDDETLVIVATHNFVDDRLAIDELLQTPVSYIGLMGPEERFETMIEDFETEGRQFTEEELDRIYTPVGLNLGGGSPYQIAISILSEVLAVDNNRSPAHLSEQAGPIHARAPPNPDGGTELDG